MTSEAVRKINIDEGAHRSDIDLLRALAVVAVLLFHAHWLPGGFVGVDVFFVISGYLMASIITGRLVQGRFSASEFYARRARRIIPVFAAVILISTIAAAALMLPSDVKQLGRSVVSAASFTSNHFFMKNAADYFAADSVVFQPLVHTWSLSVEMQFYLIFPLLLAGLWRWRRALVAPILLFIALASLATAQIAVLYASHAAFYLLPMRMWELLAGALVLFLPACNRGRAYYALSGLILIAFALAFYTGQTAFPGFAALLPVVGAALILYARPAWPVLSSAPVRHLALLSYSLYLWHWPLFALSRYHIGENLPAPVTAIILAATLLLSILSYHLVERPFLRKKPGPGLRPLALSAAMLAGLLIFGWTTRNIFPDHVQAHLPPAVQNYIAGERDYIKGDCLPAESAGQEGIPCRFGLYDAPPEILLWGNSFARMWTPALDEMASRAGASGISAIRSACPPVAVEWNSGKSECAPFNRDVTAWLESTPGIKKIILAANWVDYNDFAAAFEDTVKVLRAANLEVYVVLSPPEPGYHVPRALALSALRGEPVPPVMSRDEMLAKETQLTKTMRALAARHGFTIIDPATSMCADGLCHVEKDGRPLYYDRAHVSRFGALENREIFKGAFE